MTEKARQLVEHKRSQLTLWKATAAYLEAEEEGINTTEAVAAEVMGVSSVAELSSTQKAYLTQIVRKVAREAEKIKAEEAPASKLLEQAKTSFERNQFSHCIQLTDEALGSLRREGYAAGECEVWKAMALERLGRYDEARSTYERLRDTHPRKAIRRYADQLLRILQAPKLELAENEKVKVPTKLKLDKYKDGLGRRKRAKRVQQRQQGEIEPTLLEKAMTETRVPEALHNRQVLAFGSLAAVAIAVASAFLK